MPASVPPTFARSVPTNSRSAGAYSLGPRHREPKGSVGAPFPLAKRGQGGREVALTQPRGDDRFEFREQTSTNGGAWETTANFTYVRRAAVKEESK